VICFVFQFASPITSKDTHISYLPLAHMFERVVQASSGRFSLLKLCFPVLPEFFFVIVAGKNP